MRVAALAVLLAATPIARADYFDLYANPNDVGESKVPRFGRSRVLVLPIEIRTGAAAHVNRGELVRFFEQASDSDLRFPSYFAAQSKGRFTPEATVAPTMFFERCPDELGGGCDLDATDLNMLKVATGLLRTIIDRADRGCWESAHECEAATAIDFSEFDVNGVRAAADGFADGVVVVSAMAEAGLTVPVASTNDGGDNLAGGTGGAFVVDGVKVSQVALAASATSPGQSSLREFGHLLGLAALDQNRRWAELHPELKYGGLHGSRMGVSAGADGDFFDAESRYRLGWADVQVVSGRKVIQLRPAAQGGDVVKLGLQQRDGRREYFLAEVRASTGPYDGFFRTVDGKPLVGLSLYRIDWSEGPGASYVPQLVECLNCNPWRPFIMNVQADRRFDVQEGQPLVPEWDLFLENDVFADARNTAPFSRDNKVWGANWYDGTASGIAVKVLDVDRERGWITAEFTAPEVTDACADLRCAAGLSCVAGNCRAAGPVTPTPTPTRPGANTSGGEGWGCAGVHPGALALVALAARRRKLYD